MSEPLQFPLDDRPKRPLDLVDRAEAQIVEQLKRIDFYLTEYSLELLASKMRSGDFVVPAYQRNFTWEPERKTRFIESILMGLPIPFLFFWERDDGKLEIVDGSQRLRTIEEFILGDLELGDMEQLSLVVGFRFADLPEARQRKVRNRSIRGIVLNENADEQARFDLFDRINTSSKDANKAEIRRGALAGPFMDLIIRVANDDLFRRLAPVPRKAEQEREREELVTRFFAYGDGLEGYKDLVGDFLYKYVKKMNHVFELRPELRAEYEARFAETMRFIARVFPFGFRRGPLGMATPRARFEAIALGSFLAMRERPELAEVDPHVETWLASDEFRNVTGSDGANAVGRLRARMDFVRQRLVEA
jgi:hypothetical protein